MPPTPPADVTATTVPSIDILPQQTGLAGSCTGNPFVVNTFINVGPQASADVKLSAPGVGIVEEFTDDTGSHLNTYKGNFPTFKIPGSGGGLAPNTLVTLTITTYTGPDLGGVVSFTSSITFNCTTGKPLVLAIGPTTTIPTLSWPALVALMALLALLGAARLRRRSLSPQKL